MQGRVVSIFGNVQSRRPARQQRTDAPPQLTVFFQSNERCPFVKQRIRIIVAGRLENPAVQHRFFQRGAGNPQQVLFINGSIIRKRGGLAFESAGSGKDPGAVTDHPFPAAGSVAGIDQRQNFRTQTHHLRQNQRAVDAAGAAGLMIADFGRNFFDFGGRFPVCRLRLFVSVIMRQIRGNHQQRIVPLQIRQQRLGRFLRIHRAVNDRHDFKIRQHLLQKRQLHLQRMLVPMRRIIYPKTFTRCQPGRHFPVNRHFSERRDKPVGRR